MRARASVEVIECACRDAGDDGGSGHTGGGGE